MTVYGYARVSTAGQDSALQLAALQAAGCDQLVTESASAAQGRPRPKLQRLLTKLQAGDVLVITKLNRLARSAVDALNILAAVADRGAGFRSLGEPWADTTTAAGRMIVTVWVGLAEFDREMILERTAEGRAAAKARGVKMGRPGRLTSAQVRLILAGRSAEPPTPIGDLVALTGASRSTVERVIRAAARGQAVAIARPRQLDIEEVLEPAGDG